MGGCGVGDSVGGWGAIIILKLSFSQQCDFCVNIIKMICHNDSRDGDNHDEYHGTEIAVIITTFSPLLHKG